MITSECPITRKIAVIEGREAYGVYNLSDELIGHIAWSETLQRFAFFPLELVAFDSLDLRNIAIYCEDFTRHHAELVKTTGDDRNPLARMG